LGILAIYGWHRKPAGLSPKQAAIWIIGGGVLLPTVGLGGLLAYGLSLIPEITARAPDGSLRIVVTGEQWWWRNEYSLPDGRRFRSDNEVWLPVGEPVQFELLSADVVHSFWIPALGGKVDMIPGRTNFLALHAARTGSFRGVCAEYCGTSHALMAFEVRVVDAAEFDRWVERQIAPAQAGDEWEGAAIFRASGCGACHSVRGTTADGTVGPDLTHFGSRSTLGAGTRRNELAHLRNWLQRTAQVKPGVLMPHFGMLPDDEVDALARYLMSLQ
jgi:cytochrome c oxidase subunit 2